LTHNSTNSSRPRIIFVILVLVSLIIPHTLGIRRQNYYDNSHTRFTLVAALWTLIHESGSTIAGPYGYTLFPFPNEAALLWTTLFVPLQLCTSYVMFRFVRGAIEQETALCVVVAAFVIQAFLAGALWFVFSGSHFVALIPLPIFYLVSVPLVHRNDR
jgi:hypothetical protein